MTTATYRAPARNPGSFGLFDEMVIDCFAGGGGASTGIERALGRPVDAAINHSADAIAMHTANHPFTHHYVEDIWNVDPQAVTQGRPVGMLWASPDCTHFSRARGAPPCSVRIRGLAWIVIRWMREAKPRVVMLENVVEFETWGPLDSNGHPDPERSGHYFVLWIRQMKRLGYTVEWRALNAADYGAPTSRTRFFLIARCDGAPIVWPEPTHGPGRAQPHRSAAEIVDWSIKAPSIFLSPEEAKQVGCKRPLAAKTMARIAAGIERYVLCDDPYIVRNAAGVLSPWIVPRYGERPTQAPRTHDLRDPLPTIVPTGNGSQLVAAWLSQNNGGMVGHSMREPVSTIVGKGSTQSVIAQRLEPGAPDRSGDVRGFFTKFYGTSRVGAGLDEPVHTITPRDRFGLVVVDGVEHHIADIGLRMLTPRELYRAQGFGDDYIIDRGADGKPLTKKQQNRFVGNSVSPHISHALAAANVATTNERMTA